MDTLPHWQQMLSNRGILGAALMANWTPENAGWSYPLYSVGGNILQNVSRWKSFDSTAKPKYLWVGDGDRPRYYILPGTIEAIKQAFGAVILASGEPDVLAYRAAGAKNVLCWFGEGSVPPDLARDLCDMGVTAAECYPDRDDTGRTFARKIAERLAGSEIHFSAYELPGVDGSKSDINKLWVDCTFVDDCFWQVLANCGPMTIAEPVYRPQQKLLASGYDEFPAGFYAAIETALHIEDYRQDNWSKPIKCVLKEHEHDKPGGYAAAWNREKKIYSCLKCGETEVLAKDVGATLGIDWREFIPRKVEPPKAAPRPAPAGKPKFKFGWNESLPEVVNELDGILKDGEHEPLPMIFKNIAQYGGLAANLFAGKMIAVVGDSGAGKTSFVETLVDCWRPLGFSGIAWSPEWNRFEFIYRAIQRYGGPSFMQMIEHKAWHGAAKRGVPEDKRPGKPLDAQQVARAKEIIEMTRTWKGTLVFIEKMGLGVDELLIAMGEVVAGYAANGKRIAYVIVDYAQLLHSTGDSPNERVDTALSKFKAFCVDKQVVGVVTSQVPKASGISAAQGNNKLTHHALQNARSDYFNLVLAITREVDTEGVMDSMATVRISKNSLGSNGEARLSIKGERLRWYDVTSEPLNLP